MWVVMEEKLGLAVQKCSPNFLLCLFLGRLPIHRFYQVLKGDKRQATYKPLRLPNKRGSKTGPWGDL